MASDKYVTVPEPPARNKPPRVSIGMPAFNGERFIRQALDSLLAQTFTDFELVISDNASTDATQQICLEYAARDQRIRYYRKDFRIDAVSNFNSLLELASGDYFMWAAHDDVWEPSFVARLLQALETNPEAILAFSRFDNIDENGHQIRIFSEDWSKIFARSKFQQYAFMALLDDAQTEKANHIYGLMRKEAILACGGMVSLPKMDYSGEDNLALMRLLARGDFVIVDGILFHYRIRSVATRRDEPLADYLLLRTFKHSSAHRGNLVLFFLRNHAYHSALRRIIGYELPVPFVQKAVLWTAVGIKELWMPLKTVPRAVLRELGLMRIKRLVRADTK
jgi:glycosyltransferase involved in cell wall biosynthesis